MRFVTFDFETYPILDRPAYPPKPVGLAIRFPDEAPRYLSFGHERGENNSTEGEARELLAKAYNGGYALLCHNAKFDLCVAEKHWGLPVPQWRRINDTMVLGFIDDPYRPKMGLKPMADELLSLPPEERNAVDDWVLSHKVMLRECYPQYKDIKISKRSAGAWIFSAPAELVGQYAIGDVVRTEGLFKALYPSVCSRGMQAAYEREMHLLPILMENEREGIRVDVERLESDQTTYRDAFKQSEDTLRKIFQDDGISLDNDAAVADALVRTGLVADSAFKRTASGVRSTSKKTLTPDLFKDPRVAYVLGYRNRLATALKLFIDPWLAQAQQTGGTIHTQWNQTKSGRGGARTGRLSSSSPNLMNIVKRWEGDGYQHPAFMGWPELPLCRQYVIPDEGGVLIDRDFCGQELRMFGHYESGKLNQQYHDNPRLDVHEYIRQEMEAVSGHEVKRLQAKIMDFLSLYGGGTNAAMEQLGLDRAGAQHMLSIHSKALPGKQIVSNEILRIAKRGEPIRTWGGRLYYPEKLKNKPCPYYRLINYLIQGSSADLTKQCIIDWYDEPKRKSRFLLTIHDEIVASAPEASVGSEMRLLREVMGRDRVSVPMLSDGKTGLNWKDLEGYDDNAD